VGQFTTANLAVVDDPFDLFDITKILFETLILEIVFVKLTH